MIYLIGMVRKYYKFAQIEVQAENEDTAETKAYADIKDEDFGDFEIADDSDQIVDIEGLEEDDEEEIDESSLDYLISHLQELSALGGETFQIKGSLIIPELGNKVILTDEEQM